MFRGRTYTMDEARKKQFVFNWKLAKLGVIHHILNPSAVKLFGYNMCHVFIFFGLLIPTWAVSVLCPISFYYLTDDVILFVFYYGTLSNMFFSSHKIICTLYYSTEMWKCVGISSLDSMSYHRYDRKLFYYWRKRTIRYTNTVFTLYMTVGIFWIMCPFIFNDSTVTTKNLNSSHCKYRTNIFNMFLYTVSDTTYNTYFYFFYFLEIIVASSFVFFSYVFDLSLIMMYFSICYQLKTIHNAIESLGHEEINVLSEFRVYYLPANEINVS